MAISTIFHYYTVPFLTATTALKQMDSEFEAIGEIPRDAFLSYFHARDSAGCSASYHLDSHILFSQRIGYYLSTGIPLRAWKRSSISSGDVIR